MPSHLAKPVPTLLITPTHPSLMRARRSLEDMKRRTIELTGEPVKAGLEVIDSDIPWAGMVEDDQRKRSSMFLTRGLIDKLTHEEIVAVMGHEWGHVVKKQSWAEWALRGVALIGSLGLHLSIGSMVVNPSDAGLLLGTVCLGLTVLFMAACLTWEGRAARAQELACDRFAARLVGARTMVATLRRVDGVMKRYHGIPLVAVPFAFSWRRQWRRFRMWNTRSHPSVEDRVSHIVRHRHRLGRS